MRLRQFSAQESRKKEAGKYVGKQQWIEDFKKKISCHFSLCNLDGSGKVLKLLCGVWKEVIFKRKKIVQTNWSLVL